MARTKQLSRSGSVSSVQSAGRERAVAPSRRAALPLYKRNFGSILMIGAEGVANIAAGLANNFVNRIATSIPEAQNELETELSSTTSDPQRTELTTPRHTVDLDKKHAQAKEATRKAIKRERAQPILREEPVRRVPMHINPALSPDSYWARIFADRLPTDHARRHSEYLANERSTPVSSQPSYGIQGPPVKRVDVVDVQPAAGTSNARDVSPALTEKATPGARRRNIRKAPKIRKAGITTNVPRALPAGTTPTAAPVPRTPPPPYSLEQRSDKSSPQLIREERQSSRMLPGPSTKVNVPVPSGEELTRRQRHERGMALLLDRRRRAEALEAAKRLSLPEESVNPIVRAVRGVLDNGIDPLVSEQLQRHPIPQPSQTNVFNRAEYVRGWLGQSTAPPVGSFEDLTMPKPVTGSRLIRREQTLALTRDGSVSIVAQCVKREDSFELSHGSLYLDSSRAEATIHQLPILPVSATSSETVEPTPEGWRAAFQLYHAKWNHFLHDPNHIIAELDDIQWPVCGQFTSYFGPLKKWNIILFLRYLASDGEEFALLNDPRLLTTVLNELAKWSPNGVIRPRCTIAMDHELLRDCFLYMKVILEEFLDEVRTNQLNAARNIIQVSTNGGS